MRNSVLGISGNSVHSNEKDFTKEGILSKALKCEQKLTREMEEGRAVQVERT